MKEEQLMPKVILFMVSVLFGVIAGSIAYFAFKTYWISILLAIVIVIVLLNPVIAAFIVSTCEELHAWSFPDSDVKWSVLNRT